MRGSSRPGPQVRGGFTLLELLAVLLLTALVLGVALDFYLDLSRATNRASETTRDTRRAVAILDRIGRDLEGATLAVKPPEVDPLAHPWIFLARSQYADHGSDQLKFVTRSHRPRRSDAAESDLVQVSYTVTRNELDNLLELRRWSAPNLPDVEYMLDFPSDEDSFLVAEGLDSFSLRFLGEDGSWSDVWDSSQLLQSSQLPVAVEIEVALAPFEERELGAEAHVYSKVVVLPVRPLDFAVLLDPAAAAGAGEEASGEDTEGGKGGKPSVANLKPHVTVGDCINRALLPPGFKLSYFEANRAKKLIEVQASQGAFPVESISAHCLK